EITPPFVIHSIGAAVDHCVGRTRPAQCFTARPVDLTILHLWLRLGFVSPIALGLEELRKGSWNMDLLYFVRTTRFEQQNFDVSVLGQTIGQHASSRTGPDDYVVEHGSSVVEQTVEFAPARFSSIY